MITMETCNKCGQQVEIEYLFLHMWARHAILHTKEDFEMAKTYFEKYPGHRFDRVEWVAFIERVDPSKAYEIANLDGDEFIAWCSEYAQYYADKIKREAKEETKKHIEELRRKNNK